MNRVENGHFERSLAGFNLVEISTNYWALEVIDAGTFEGSFRDVVKFAIISYAFNVKEIDDAVQEMLATGNNSAHFGMWGNFIFSFMAERERKVS